jgi:Smg protein
MTESQGSVLDILIYVFDRYMLTDTVAVPERDELAQDLERQGFSLERVEQALDWLADLAGERDRPGAERWAAGTGAGGVARSLRVYTPGELERLPSACRGYLYTLEHSGILSPPHRELVIERLLALEAPELDVEQLNWIVLMVLSSQPGEELACSRLEGLMFDMPERPH